MRLFIGIDRYILGKIVVAFDILKCMGTSILRITALVDKIRQHGSL